MSSPHERDGKTYGFNQDPYTRDPYRDPYTGYQTDNRSASTAAEPVPVHTAKPFLDNPKDRRSAIDPGVTVGKFVGGVLASAVLVALTAWLLCGVILAAIYRAVPATYWPAHNLVAPSAGTGATVTLSIVAVLCAALVLWGLIALVPAPALFFTALGLLATAAVTLLTALGGPWETHLGPAVVRAVLGLLTVTLIASIGRLTTTRPAYH